MIVDELDKAILVPKKLESLPELIANVPVPWIQRLELTFKGINVVKGEGSADRPPATDRVLQLDSPSSCHAYRVLAPLLMALARAGIELAPHPTDAGRLRHRPAELPPGFAERLRAHRAAILSMLASDGGPDHDEDAAYVFDERLGMADGLGMPTHTGSTAWLVAAGESIDAAPARAERDAPAIVSERLAAVLSDALAMAVRVSTLPPGERFPGERFPGEPDWRDPLGYPARCPKATDGVHSGHGIPDRRDRGGGEGKRADPLCDREGGGCEPFHPVAAAERGAGAGHGNG